ncbi:MAG: glycoside hydrolase family 97 protein [Bacteroidaceae bacterium]|nr:glycoside hydrolase family 97 protein [Bacteroidaceae bacterium]
MNVLAAKAVQIKSPNGQLIVELNTQKGQLGWTVSRSGQLLYTMEQVGMTLSNKTVGVAAGSVRQRSCNETIRPVVPLKQSDIQSSYTEARAKVQNGTLVLRVLDNAVAYRFETTVKGEVEVTTDRFILRPAVEVTTHVQLPNSWRTSCEESYTHQSIDAWKESGKFAITPALLSGPDDLQMLIAETDLRDYPHLCLRPTADGAIESTFPPAPAKYEWQGDRGFNVTEEAPYYAKTQGTRSFAWRYVVITDSKGLLTQTIPTQLAPKNELSDVSWIKPGKVIWEWWNGATPFGPDVTFKAGCNYETYCYFADFAAKYGIEYILLDEGWAKSTRDPFVGNDDLRLHDLIAYCKQKGVGVILWLPWLTAELHMDLFQRYAEWGVAGVKIDFMDHFDQWMVNFYERIVRAAADNHLLIDLHGAYTPAGLEYRYPNFISYEGVRGLEQMGGCPPDNTIFIPFIRNAVGAADFTPGGMFNAQPGIYASRRPNSAAMGTRCFQMALYVVLESGVQMLADNPTRYYQNEDCARYIASVPVVWDETRCLSAVVGNHAVLARRTGQKWFLGAVQGTNEPQTVRVRLNFLPAGRTFKLKAFVDGINADYQAMHYNVLEQEVSSTTELNIKMARNGGFAAVIE